jgi:signal transduction histidine kinase
MKPPGLRPPWRRRGWGRLLVLIGLAGYVIWVYVIVVLGGGALIGRTDSPSVALSVVATTGVALSFSRVQRALERGVTRGGWSTATPYDVLRAFPDAATGAVPTDELPARMAMLLAKGTGASWAQVWLNVSDRLTLAAAWPEDGHLDQAPPSLDAATTGASRDGLRTLAVREGGQLLGLLRVQERPGLPLTLVEQRLLAGLAAQAGLVLKSIALRVELAASRARLLIRSDELQASRQRLIEAQDAERRRLERDLHDGAQQHLVALTVNLSLARTIIGTAPGRAAAVLSKQSAAADAAIETLSALSRGIYPRQLAEEGLVAALRSAVSASPLPVTVVAHDVPRLPGPVEAALYFCCMEAMQNAAKHAGAHTVTVRVCEKHGRWQLTVADDGAGFRQDSAQSSGAGLANMRDRLDAVGGTVEVSSLAMAGTTVTATAPRQGG